MLITLTTDFGLDDVYVATMKGVILGIAPDASLVDITHTLAPQDIQQAAFVLWASVPYFPQPSVHLVVVDPGVGTFRRALATRTSWGILVGPDNGIFSYVWASATTELTVALESPKFRRATVSPTFHGRDVFAPAAAYIASGVSLDELGPHVQNPVRLPLPALEVRERSLRGEVIHIDRFGNAITSIGRLVWEGPILHLDPAFGEGEPRTLNAERVRVVAGDNDVGPIRHTYGVVPVGRPLALVGSEGLLEVGVNQGHGAQELDLQVGDPVEIRVV